MDAHKPSNVVGIGWNIKWLHKDNSLSGILDALQSSACWLTDDLVLLQVATLTSGKLQKACEAQVRMLVMVLNVHGKAWPKCKLLLHGLKGSR